MRWPLHSWVALMHWAAFELLGGMRTSAAPIKLIFWESPWGRAGAGSGGMERLMEMACVWRALYWGRLCREALGVLVWERRGTGWDPRAPC